MRKFAIFAATLLLTVSACRSGVEGFELSGTVLIRAAYRDSQCASDKAKIEPISDETALADWWRSLAEQQVPAKPMPQSLGAIDFERSVVFVVFMGRRPTTGFGIELQSDRAPVQRASLTIPAIWQEPPPDAMVAMVVTSPCVVFAVPNDQYETVSVRDRQGNALLEIRF